jgi:hypothetical protein
MFRIRSKKAKSKQLIKKPIPKTTFYHHFWPRTIRLPKFGYKNLFSFYADFKKVKLPTVNDKMHLEKVTG